MTVRLPLVAPYAKEHTYCAYCPKLCRHTCPVSTVEGRETTTPWGKMSALHHVALGEIPFTEDHAAPWYACTGCGRCQSNCRHDNDVAGALSRGRAEALRQGHAPPAAQAIVASAQRRAEKLKRASRALVSGTSSTAVVPGCTSVVTNRALAESAVELAKRIDGQSPRVVADTCCGLPLLEAGDRDGFLKQASRFVARFESAKYAVVDDPGCLEVLRTILPTFVKSTSAIRFEHTSEYAARHLDRFAAPPEPYRVRYHDSCRLGRKLGIYDAPRRVLAHVTGEQVLEMPHHGEGAECSGAGGQLPRTMPATANAIAEERRADHERVGGGVLVTACASTHRHYRKNGFDAEHFTELVVRSLPEP